MQNQTLEICQNTGHENIGVSEGYDVFTWEGIPCPPLPVSPTLIITLKNLENLYVSELNWLERTF